jgi:hypothetical protein
MTESFLAAMIGFGWLAGATYSHRRWVINFCTFMAVICLLAGAIDVFTVLYP